MASLTVLSTIVLPSDIAAAGVRGTSIRNNTRATGANGRMRANINWDRSRRRWELGTVPMLIAQWQTVEGIFEATDGGAYGFLMTDPHDNTCAAAAGKLYGYASGALVGAAGTGYGVPAYRLYKRYTAGNSAVTKDRRISRPVATPTLTRGASPVTIGVAAGHAAVDTATGTVTFVADSSSTVTVVTVGATTVVTLTAALAGLIVGGRLYLSGLTGADAALLNGLSHAITVISGGGSNVYTLSTVTTGKVITAAGSGFKYPQASEALAWSGSFYAPVHFENDQIDWDLMRAGPYDLRLVAGPSVILQEVVE